MSFELRRKLLRVLYVLSLYSGINSLFYYLNRRRQVVLTYHNILPDALFDDSLHLGVSHSERVFERHLEIINKRWPVTTTGDVCLVTLDDGYANQYEIAAAVLERHGRRGVFFVTLGLVLNQAPLWVDRLLMWFSYVPNGRYQVLDERLEIRDGASRSACWRVIWRHISQNYGRLDELVNSLEAAFPFDKLSIDPRLKALRFEGMTLDQIRHLIRKGHRVGCHSYEHDILSRLPRAALDSDFARCESEMDRVFNCDFYSYPFGGPVEVTEREEVACRKSRFRRAFLNVDTVAAGKSGNDYATPRVSLPNTMDRYVVEAKLCGFERAVKNLLMRA